MPNDGVFKEVQNRVPQQDVHRGAHAHGVKALRNKLQKNKREDESGSQGEQVLLHLFRPLLPQDDKASPQQFRQRSHNSVKDD